MKSAAVFLLSLGLAFSGFAAVPSIDKLTEILSRGPWAELPVRAAGAVRHAKASERKEMTISVIKAALRLNPAAATAVVGSIARAVPAMAAVAAETAAGEQPKQASDIALAAAAADHSAAADIVVGVCRAVPAQYESIADAVADAVPGSGKEVLGAVETAEPELKVPIDQVMAQYNGYVPPVSLVLSQAKPIAGTEPSERKPYGDVRHKPRNPNGNPTGGEGGGPPNHYKTP
jgi:hypothetical protein